MKEVTRILRSDKFASLSLACALALYGATTTASAVVAPVDDSAPPTSAQLSALAASNTLADCSTEPDDPNSDANGDADDLCGNPFARVLTAPFRGLASLFGDDKKGDKKEQKDATRADAAKKNDQSAQRDTTNTTSAASVANAPATSTVTTSTRTTNEATNSDQPTYAPAPADDDARAPQYVEQTAPRIATANPVPTPSPAQTPALAAFAPARAVETVEPFTPLVVGVPNDPISQGRALIKQGLFSQAISELSVAAATGVNLVEANNLLGLAYDHRGEHQQAQQFYARALTLAPTDAHVLSNLGYSLYLDNRPKDALAKLKQAQRLDPSSAEVYNNLGFVFAKLNKFDSAFNCFAQAGGDLYARLRTAALLEDAGRDRDAIKHYEAARKLEPDSTETLRRLITLYNRTGQRSKAEAAERSFDKSKSKTSASTTG